MDGLEKTVSHPALEKMRTEETHRSGPQVDPVFQFPILVPASTFFLPHRVLVDLIEVLIKIIRRFLFHANGQNAFFLDLLRQFNDVLDDGFDSRDQAAVAPCGTRTLEDQVSLSVKRWKRVSGGRALQQS